MSPNSGIDLRYVASRRALLDALEALAPHGPAVIVVGAQAIYLRTGSSDAAIAPYTTDGDLALDPSELGDEPSLESSMTSGGFRLDESENTVVPGVWVTTTMSGSESVDIPVDLIVPEAASSGEGRRGARLGVHGKRAARRAVGLEAALVDHQTMQIAALEESDGRVFNAEVAGLAALLVAKLHKIDDRVDSGRIDRLRDKDAADVYRIMQTGDIESIAETLTALRSHPLAGRVTTDAIGHLGQLFGTRSGEGIAMAQRALRLVADEVQVATLCLAFTRTLDDRIGA